MTGKTHVTAGVAAGLTLAVGYPEESKLILVVAASIGSLIPDIDHANSKINQKVLLVKNKLFKMITYSILGIGFILSNDYFDASDSRMLRLLGITLILTGLSRHRSFTHSLLGLTLFSTIVYLGTSKYNLKVVFIGFTIGYISHLVLDLITVRGIELLFPLKKKIRLLLGIKTNSATEHLILAAISLYLACLLIWYI